jgi:phospholipase C
MGASRAGAGAGVHHAVVASPIKHVVVIFQENRSFDEVLGKFCRDHGGRCDGYVGPVHLSDGSVVPMAQSPDIITPDPPHNVAIQAAEIDHGKMDGWVNIPECMANGVNQCLSYYTEAQIPALAALANAYVVSDRTFSMQDSPSWGGHMAVVAATQDNFTGSIPVPAPGMPVRPGWGCDSNTIAKWIDPATKQQSMQPSCIPAPAGVLDPAQYPYRGAFRQTPVTNVPTIFDRLDAKGLPWKLYASIVGWSICPTFAKCIYGPQGANLVPPSNIFTDAKNGHLPAYSVLLPSGPNGTGQHPPSSMLLGDNWIAKEVNAIQAGPDWSSTAIFITYDDCGCFYDHVPPPGKNPDGTDQGIREPMVIISPYAKRAYTDSNPATFASILRFTEETFGLAALGVNDAQAYDYANSFNFTQPGTAPRVWPPQQPVSDATLRSSAAAEAADGDDPT